MRVPSNLKSCSFYSTVNVLYEWLFYILKIYILLLPKKHTYRHVTDNRHTDMWQADKHLDRQTCDRHTSDRQTTDRHTDMWRKDTYTDRHTDMWHTGMWQTDRQTNMWQTDTQPDRHQYKPYPSCKTSPGLPTMPCRCVRGTDQCCTWWTKNNAGKSCTFLFLAYL